MVKAERPDLLQQLEGHLLAAAAFRTAVQERHPRRIPHPNL